MGWTKNARINLLAALFALNMPSCSLFLSSAPADADKTRQDKRALRQHLADRYSPQNNQPVEAVFILPMVDSAGKATEAKRAAYDIQRALNGRDLPCFILGDTATGAGDYKSVGQQVAAIQKQQDRPFKAATILDFTHGSLYDWKTGKTYMDTADVKNAWQADSADLTHQSQTTLKDCYNSRNLYKAIAENGALQNLHIVSFSCYGGAMQQWEMNEFKPCKTTYAALCGPTQVSWTSVHTGYAAWLVRNNRTADDMRATSVVADVMENALRPYAAAIVIADSQGGAATLATTDRCSQKCPHHDAANAAQWRRLQASAYAPR